jgi:Uma2 family endonuclease
MLDKIILKGEQVLMTDEEFFDFCQANAEVNIERNAQREIIIMSPTGSRTGAISLKISTQLEIWNEQSGSGIVFDSTTGFTLPDGSVLSPDASWLSAAKWQALSDEDKRRFAPVCPEFVVELKSDSDRLTDLQQKMESWLTNGALLGWLIVVEEEKVYIYQKESGMEEHQGFDSDLSADPVLPGFSLKLSKLRIA